MSSCFGFLSLNKALPQLPSPPANTLSTQWTRGTLSIRCSTLRSLTWPCEHFNRWHLLSPGYIGIGCFLHKAYLVLQDVSSIGITSELQLPHWKWLNTLRPFSEFMSADKRFLKYMVNTFKFNYDEILCSADFAVAKHAKDHSFDSQYEACLSGRAMECLLWVFCRQSPGGNCWSYCLGTFPLSQIPATHSTIGYPQILSAVVRS